MQIKQVKEDCMILLGKQGENLATGIQFPSISHWITAYGIGTVQLLHQRSGDEAAYPCVIQQTDDVILWPITSADVEKAGTGWCELRYTVNDAVVKSATWQTLTAPALDCSDSAPEPWQSWVDEVLAAVNNVESVLDHYPYIDAATHHWMLWDAVNEQWVDTYSAAVPASSGGQSFQIHELTETVSIADVDELPLYDTSAEDSKKLTWSHLKATLKNYFDTLYSTFSGSYSDLTNRPAIPSVPSTNKLLKGDENGGMTAAIPGTDYLTTHQDISGKQNQLLSSGASIGQIPRIASVDANGKPTAWEPVNLPECKTFIAYYGITTFSQIQAAATAGKIVCLYNTATDRVYDLSSTSNTVIQFGSVQDNVIYLASVTSANAWSASSCVLEVSSQKVNSVSSASTTAQYPSAKAVYDYAMAKKATVSLSSAWTQSGNVYSQSITVSGTTSSSKIDLQPDTAMLQAMLDDGVTALWVENNNGTITVKCLGAALSASHTVQCTITEVST